MKTALLVDVLNIYYSSKKIFGKKMDYNKLLEILTKKGFDIKFSIAYIVSKRSLNTSSFESSLEKLRFYVKRKVLNDAYSEAKFQLTNWNVGIALDMVHYSNTVENLILVSGNKVLAESIPYMNKQCNFYVASYAESTSPNLILNKDRFINLSNPEYTDLVTIRFKDKSELENHDKNEIPESETEKVNKYVQTLVEKEISPSPSPSPSSWGMFE